MMEFLTINKTCYYFNGPVNIGYVKRGDEGLLIDAGIDASTMKKVMKELKQKELPITYLFITHAHADHYGGAKYLQDQHKVYTIAPVLEEAILRNPVLEPLYLFGGNDPLPELRNKFLEGSPIHIDQVVTEGEMTIGEFSFSNYQFPGHSYHQLGILIDEILYAGDAYFSQEQLDKHKIPFLTDAALAMESLAKVKEVSCYGAVPGHGIFEQEFRETVQKNIAYHQTLLDNLFEKIDFHPEGFTHETVVADMCEEYGVKVNQLSHWLMFRTAVTSYLIALIKQEKIESSIEKNRWVFRVKEG